MDQQFWGLPIIFDACVQLAQLLLLRTIQIHGVRSPKLNSLPAMKIKSLIRPLLVLLVIAPAGYFLPNAYSWVQTLGNTSHDQESEHNGEHAHSHAHKVIVTNPRIQEVTTQKPYVCQVRSCRHIDIRALSNGYLQDIHVKEGQIVKTSDLMFQILPTLYKARYESEAAEAQLVGLEYNNTKSLVHDKVLSQQELPLAAAKLARANAKAALAKAELGFTEIRAPFEGIIDRLHEQKGSLVAEGDILTTLSDNSTVWVYFNVPEARYLEYKSEPHQEDLQVQLILANGKPFNQQGHIGAIEADFNNETGNIAFRADFPNPEGLLRHGQTGTIVISHRQHDSLVIPQRATFEILAKKYVFVVDSESVAHQREIEIGSEMEDIFIIKSGLQPEEKIVLEGVQQVRDGSKIDFEFADPEDVLNRLKFKAE